MAFSCLVQAGLLSFFDPPIFGQKPTQSQLFHRIRIHKTAQRQSKSVPNSPGQGRLCMQILTFDLNVHFVQHVGTFENGEDLFAL